MKLIEQLLQLLAAASGMKLDDVAAVVKKADGSIDDEATKLNTDAVNAAFAKKLKEAGGGAPDKDALDAKFEEGRKKGVRQGAENLEKLISETFKVDGEGKEGEALVKHIAAKVATTKKGEKGELTQAEVEASPFFTAGVTAARKAAEEEKQKAAKELADYKASIESSKLMDEVWSVGEGFLKDLNLNLSEDPERRSAQISVIRRELEQHKFRREKDGTITVLKEDGTPLKDDLHNLIAYKDLVTKTATRYYEPLKGEKRTAPKVDPDADKGKGGDGNKGKWNKPMPKNNDEYLAIASDPSIPVDERMHLTELWDKAQEPG